MTYKDKVPVYGDHLRSMGVTYQRSGHNGLILCPFHDEQNASCSVHLFTGQFFCFSCKAKGDFVDLYAKINNLDRKNAEAILIDSKVIHEMTILANEVDILLSGKADKGKTYIQEEAFHQTFPKCSDPRYCDYWKSRDLEPAFMDLYDCREGRGEKNIDRIVLPIRDENGYIVSYSARDITGEQKPKLRRPPDLKVSNVLFGLYELYADLWKNQPWNTVGARRLVLVEGEFDAIYLQQYGLPGVSILGSYLDSAQGRIIVRECSEVYVAADGDKAGRDASNQIRSVLEHELPVFDIRLPEGVDPNDLSEEQIEKLFPSEVFIDE